DATTTGFRETGLTHTQRVNVYSAEAGVQTAARRARDSFLTWTQGGQIGPWSCPTPTSLDATSGINNGTAVSVDCVSGVTATLDQGGRPGQAILTVGAGLTVDKGPGAKPTPGVNTCNSDPHTGKPSPGVPVNARVGGDIWSGTTISIPDPCTKLNVQGA